MPALPPKSANETHFAYETDKDRSDATQAPSHPAGEAAIDAASQDGNLACGSAFLTSVSSHKETNPCRAAHIRRFFTTALFVRVKYQ